MAASLLRPALSFPPPTGEGGQTPPAKRFAPGDGTTAKTVTHSASCAAGVGRKLDEEQFRLYDLALRVYTAVRNGRLVEGVNFPDAATKRKVYRLVFDVLYHWQVIEELLIESGFYSKNCDLHGQESLIQLMAFDYQDKKFSLKLSRTCSENIPSVVVRVGEALYHHRVRLNAALARMRVKSNTQTTSQLMSEVPYLKYRAVVTQPLYVRVNSRRTGNIQTQVLSVLCDDGFMLCSGREELQKGWKSFCQLDRHLLAFSPDAMETILQHQLLNDGYLVQQDSASYFLIERMKSLLAQCPGDVIVTHCRAGVEVGHIASLLTGDAKVIVYGVLPVQMDSLTRNLHTQHINNVEFVHAPFTHADASDEDLADVSAIICLPPSSLSTVAQPLDFIHQEGDHLVPLLLSDKARSMCSMTREQTRTLIHALNFSQSQLQYVVYAVRSQEKCETSNVVSACLEQHRGEMKEGDRDFLHTPLPCASGTESDVSVAGYNVTVLERKPPDPAPRASDIIAKAVASGVLSGEGLQVGECTSTQHTPQSKKKRKKKQQIFSQHTGIPMTISAQNKVVSRKLQTADANSPRPFR